MQHSITILAEAAEEAEPIRIALGKNGKPASWTKTIKKLSKYWKKHHPIKDDD